MASEAENQNLGEIEVGFTRVQAEAVVKEIDALWRHSNHDGKKCVKELRRLRETLVAALKIEEAL